MPNGNDDQLTVQQQINELLSSRNAMFQEMEASLARQVATSAKLCEAMDKCRQTADRTAQECSELTECLEQGTEEAGELGDALDGAADAAEETSGGIGSIISGAVGLLGIGSIFGKITGMAQGLFSALGSITSAIFNIGLSILAIPFTIFGEIVKMAGAGGGGGGGLREAMEAVREEFGSLASNEGLALAKSLDGVRKNMGNLVGTSRSMQSIFGRGTKGLVELLKYNAELAKALGVSLNGVMDIFSGDNAAKVAIFSKGMGLAAEQSAALISRAKAMGEDPIDAMHALGNQAVQLGEKFDVSSKVIGKAMGEMIADVDTFGHMSTESFGATSAYAVKLGIDIKQLAGVMDKFLNFEDAADSVAQLNQVFGAQVDVMKLVNAESGGEQIDMMRKAMFAAGKEAKNMSMAERKLLQQQTGLSGASFDNAFSMEKQAISYDNMAKASENAADAQLSQAKVLKELSRNIKYIIGGGGGQAFTSFLDALAKGFAFGVRRSGPFMQMLRNIRKSLKITYRAGKAMGKMFVDMFPGIKKMIGGLADIFNPKRFKVLMNKIKGVFSVFMGDIAGNKPGSVKSFLESIKTTFVEWFSGGSAGGGQILGGLQEFWNAFLLIVEQLIPLIGQGIAWAFDTLTAFIEDPGQASVALEAIGRFFTATFSRLWEVLAPVGPIIGDAFMRLATSLDPHMQVFYQWVSDRFADMGSYIWDQFISSLFGQVILGIAAMTAGKAILGIAGSLFGGMFSAITSLLGIGGTGGMAILTGWLEALANISYGSILKAMLLLTGISGLMILLVNAAIIPMAKAIGESDSFGPKEAAGFGILMVSMLGAVKLAMLSAMPLGQLGESVMAKTLVGMLAVAAFLMILGTVFAVNIKMIVMALGGLDGDAAASIFMALASVIGSLLILLPVAFAMGALLATGYGAIAVGVITAGFVAIGGFLTAFIYSLLPAIREIATLDVGDPTAFAKKMGAVTDLIQAMGPLISINAAFSNIEEAKPAEIEAMIKANSDGIIGTLKGLKDLVIPFVQMSTGLSASQIKSAKKSGELLGSLSEFLGVIQAPMIELMKITAEVADEDIDDFARTLPGLMAGFKDVMIQLVQGIGVPIKQMIDGIMKIDVDVSNVEEMHKKMGIIGHAAKVAGHAAKAMLSVFSAAGGGALLKTAFNEKNWECIEQQWGEEAKSRKRTQIVKRITAMISSLVETLVTDMTTQMEKLMGSVGKLYGKLKTAMGGATHAQMSERISLVADAMQLVSTFGTTMSGLMSTMAPNLADIDLSDTQKVGKMLATVGIMSSAIIGIMLGEETPLFGFAGGYVKKGKGLPHLIEGIAKVADSPLITKLVSDKSLPKKIRLLTDLMGIASTFASMAGGIMKAFPRVTHGPGDTKVFDPKPLEQIAEVVKQIKQPMRDLIQQFVGGGTAGEVGLIGLIPTTRGLAGKVKSIKDIMGAATDILSVIKTLGGMNIDRAMVGKIKVNLGYVAEVFQGGVHAKVPGSDLGSVMTPLSIPAFAKFLASKGAKIPAIKQSQMDGIASMNSFLANFTVLMPTIKKAGTLAKERYAESIASIVSQIGQMNEALSGLPELSVQAAIVNFGKAAAIGEGSYQIGVKAANVNINVNVSVSLNRGNTIMWLAGSGASSTDDLAVRKK